MRLLASLATVLALVLGAAGWLSVVEQESAIGAVLHDQGNAVARSLAAFSVEPMASQDYPALENSLSVLGRSSGRIIRIEVTRAGRTVARYGVASGGGVPYVADVVAPMAGGEQKVLGQLTVTFSERRSREIIMDRVWDVSRDMGILFLVLLVVLLLSIKRVLLNPLALIKQEVEGVLRQEAAGGRGATVVPALPGDELLALRSAIQSLVAGLRVKEAERSSLASALADVESVPANITDTLAMGLLLLDAEGRVEHANPVACDLLGWKLSDIRGRPLTDFLPMLAPEMERIHTAVMNGKRLQWGRLPASSPSGRGKYVDVAVHSLGRAVTARAIVHLEGSAVE